MSGGWRIALAVLTLMALYGVGIGVGGQFDEFMAGGLPVLPFTVLAVLAYLGVERRWARVLACIAMAGLLAASGLFALLVSVAALAATANRSSYWVLSEVALAKIGFLVAGLGLASILGAAVLRGRTRRALSRLLPINPGSFVHMVALVVVLTLTLVSLVPLLAIGEPPILAIMAGPQAADFFGGLDSGEALRQDTYVLIWTVVGSVFAVGYAVRRSLREGLERLGLVRPTRRQALGAIGVAVALVVAASGLEGAIGWVWEALGWPRTDSALVNKLFEARTSPLGAIVVGVTAGLGEELSVRGVLQPRLGLLLSNVFFVSLHAFQYNWDGLLVVFFLGTVLGLVRRRTNTTTSAIAHGTYDFLLIMAVAMEVPGFSH